MPTSSSRTVGCLRQTRRTHLALTTATPPTSGRRHLAPPRARVPARNVTRPDQRVSIGGAMKRVSEDRRGRADG
jgi:hypothetical protein